MRLRQHEGDVGIALWSAGFSSASGGNNSVLFAADCVCSRRCAASERTLVFPQFCSVALVKGSNYVAPRAARCNNRAAEILGPGNRDASLRQLWVFAEREGGRRPTRLEQK